VKDSVNERLLRVTRYKRGVVAAAASFHCSALDREK
jgi:hypothetical protein